MLASNYPRDSGEGHPNSDTGGSTFLSSRGEGVSYLLARVWMNKAQLPVQPQGSEFVQEVTRSNKTLWLSWLQGKTFNYMSA